MPNRTVYFAVIAVAVVAAPLLAIIVLTFQILLADSVAANGLLTLTFDFADAPSATSSPSAVALPQRDLLKDLQDGASSLLAVAATRVSGATGHVESAISSAVSSLPDLPRLDDYVPHNCSFGTHQFCVGYRREQSLACSDAPFDISALLPDEVRALPGPVADALYERLGGLSPLVEDLSDLPTSLLVCLIVGTACMMLALAVSTCLAFDNRISRKVGPRAQMLVHLLMAMCCAPYLTLVLKQTSLVDRLEKLPTWVAVEKGEVFGYSVGLFVCAALFVALSAVMTCEKVVQWIKDRLCASNSAA